ncbi:MAG TPA: hypothetical protein VGK16_02385 [Candidatus Limnocylindrales bacterium]
MAARRSTPGQPAVPKAWRRESGTYVSSDGRFAIESGGAGRWFVTDRGSLDELGLARTLGAFDTLDAAKAAAVDRREQGSEASPLAARLAAAKDRPPAGSTRKRKPTGRTKLADAADDGGQAATEPEPTPEPEPAADPEPQRTWFDELGDTDPGAARAARRAIDALERHGIGGADALVRRDVLGRQPAVAARLLGHSLALALRDRLDPSGLARDARAAIPGPLRSLSGVDEAALAAYTAFVAARVLEATLDVVASAEKADGAAADLPGWRLVERPGARDAGDGPPRRLIVTAADVTAD